MAEATADQATNDMPLAIEIAGRYPHVVDYLLSAPWAIRPEKMRAIADVIVHRAYRGEMPVEAIEAAKAQQRPSDIVYATAGGIIPAAEIAAAGGRPPTDTRNVTAVIPIMGTILPRVSSMDESSGMFSLARFRRELSALANDPAISAIVLDIDSPGGSVSMVQETAAEIRAARAKKTIATVADTLAASAAYWLFSQGTPGYQYVSPSGLVGSVGVISAHEDVSRALDALGVTVNLVTSAKAPFKAEGNPYEPLGAEARAEMQRLVDSYHADFRQGVASGRRVTVAQVDEQFGGGRVVRARDAVDRGMADHVGGLEDALSAVAGGGAGRMPGGQRAEDESEAAPRALSINAEALGAALAAGLVRQEG